MKLLILSDIHSNIYALEAIWAQEQDCDAVYCAGDLVDFGPYPKEVLDWIHSNKVPTVRGNHDLWVCMNYRNGRFPDTLPPEEREWVHHNLNLLDETDIKYLENLPETLIFSADGIDYSLTHLYEQEYTEIVNLYQYEDFRQERFEGADYSRLIIGHTHRQAVRYLSNELLWLNPGSASYRRRGDPDQTAHYATIIDGRISLHRLEYDLTPLYQITQTLDLNESHKAAGLAIMEPR